MSSELYLAMQRLNAPRANKACWSLELTQALLHIRYRKLYSTEYLTFPRSKCRLFDQTNPSLEVDLKWALSATEISCNRWERHAELTISVAMSHIDVQISTPRGLCREANVQVGDIEQCLEEDAANDIGLCARNEWLALSHLSLKACS